jgi:hypothetical protein
MFCDTSTGMGLLHQVYLQLVVSAGSLRCRKKLQAAERPSKPLISAEVAEPQLALLLFLCASAM